MANSHVLQSPLPVPYNIDRLTHLKSDFLSIVSMSGIETVDMHPRTVDQGQLTTDSASVLEDLSSLPSHLTG